MSDALKTTHVCSIDQEPEKSAFAEPKKKTLSKKQEKKLKKRLIEKIAAQQKAIVQLRERLEFAENELVRTRTLFERASIHSGSVTSKANYIGYPFSTAIGNF